MAKIYLDDQDLERAGAKPVHRTGSWGVYYSKSTGLYYLGHIDQDGKIELHEIFNGVPAIIELVEALLGAAAELRTPHE